MATYHTSGSLVWVHDAADGWVKGTVEKVDGKKLLVRTEKGSVASFAPEDCPLQNPLARMGVEVRRFEPASNYCISKCRQQLLQNKSDVTALGAV